MDRVKRFDEADLVAQLGGLSSDGKALFAAAAAERVLLGYSNRWNRKGSTEASLLRPALDVLWRDLEGPRAPAGALESELQECLALVRDEDLLVEQVECHREDVVAAVCYSLRARIAHTPQEAACAARRAYETLDLFVQRKERIDYRLPGAEDELLSSPLVQAELARQQRDISELDATTEDGFSGMVRMFRERAAIEGTRFFGQESTA